jgi:hypothetical protein
MAITTNSDVDAYNTSGITLFCVTSELLKVLDQESGLFIHTTLHLHPNFIAPGPTPHNTATAAISNTCA